MSNGARLARLPSTVQSALLEARAALEDDAPTSAVVEAAIGILRRRVKAQQHAAAARETLRLKIEQLRQLGTDDVSAIHELHREAETTQFPIDALGRRSRTKSSEAV